VSNPLASGNNGKSLADASTGMSRNRLRYKAIARVATLVDLRASKHSDLLRMRMRRRPERAE
jgi:hypothetical protein